MLRTRTAVAVVALAFAREIRTPQQPPIIKEAWRVAAESGDSILFDDVDDIDIDAKGNVYVLDAKRPRIVVIDSSGHVLRTMGRKGAGPAEIMSPNGLVVDRDGSVWAQDRAAGRTIVFDANGNHKASFPGKPFSIETPWPAIMLESGELADHISDRRGVSYGKIVRETPSGGLLTVRDSLDLGTEPVRKMLGPGDARSVVPFAPSLQYGITPQGFVWVANTAEFRLRKIGFDGKVVATVERAAAAVAIKKEVRERAAAGVARFIGVDVPVSEIPSTFPVVSALYASRDGSVWAVRPDTAATFAIYEHFSATGAPLPTVRAPQLSSARIVIFTAHDVYAVLRSADDVPMIVRFRLP